MQDLNSYQIEDLQQKVHRTLQNISLNINEIIKEQRPFSCKVSLIEAYSMVYDGCISKPSNNEQMLTYFKHLLAKHLTAATEVMEDRNRIREFNNIHDSFVIYAQILGKRVFSYLDRYYLPARDLGSLFKIAMVYFYQKMLESRQRRDHLMNEFIQILGEYRANLVLTDNQLSCFSINLIKLNEEFYEQIKGIYLKESQQFYKRKYTESKTLPPYQFFPKMYNLSLFEDAITNKCLLWSMGSPKDKFEVRKIFLKQIIQPYLEVLFSHEQGFVWALKYKKISLLNSIIEVAIKFQSLPRIKEQYYEYIRVETKEFIRALETEKDEGRIIQLLLAFIQDHNSLLIKGFMKNQELQVTLSNALESVFGKWDRYSQVLFNYCRMIVERGQFASQTDKITVVFQKLVNKDEFIHKCQKWLEELLLSESTLLTYPSLFFNFLHDLCGSENTLRLQNLMKDYTTENSYTTLSQLKPKVLSFHLWERRFKDDLAIDLQLPECLAPVWKDFESIYGQQNSKKKLILLPLASTVALTMRFRERLVTIRCNLLQCCLLLSLAAKGKTSEELQQQINAEKHLLQSFMQLSKLIVVREGVYEVDWNAQVVETMDLTMQLQQQSKFTKAIEQDRSILLQAGIVKVVKRRKQISFEEIYSHLCQSIKMFKPQPAMVKSTIEKLVNKDYIEQNQQGLYLYKQ